MVSPTIWNFNKQSVGLQEALFLRVQLSSQPSIYYSQYRAAKMSKGKRKAEGREEADAGGESRKRARTSPGQSIDYQNGNNMHESAAETIVQNRTSSNSRNPEGEAKRMRRKAKSERRMLKKIDKATQPQEPGLRSKVPGDSRAALTASPEKRSKISAPEDVDVRWSVSSGIGGCLRDLDPVFSIDEQSVIIPLICT